MKRQAIPTQAVWAFVVLSTGCATYSPAPIDPLRVLEELDAAEWTSVELESSVPPIASDRPQILGPRELAAFAVTTNPLLAALRAEVGVRNALLVEAGLLPDPEIGWDAMDVLASQLVEGSSSSVDVLSGLGLTFPLLRPGERDARVGAAEWRAEEARRLVTSAEWSLTRDIHIAYEEVLGAETLLTQTRTLTELAASTHEYFVRAYDADAATAIQKNLALGQLQAVRLEGIRTEARLQQARQDLNALLGLPPGVELELRRGKDPSASDSLRESTDALTRHAVASRPDLATLGARYQTAEEEVRLAVAKQFPSVSVGTGIVFRLPIFSKFGQPGLKTAIAKREQIGREFTAAVHIARNQIAAAHTIWRLAEQEAALVEREILPNAEQNLKLSQTAFTVGEVTLLETLALQRALIDARTQHTETRAERSKRAWALLAASGWLLGPATTNHTNTEEDSE
jgi:outer membrane protein, heavy metal efflux system